MGNPMPGVRTVRHADNYTRESRVCEYGGKMYVFSRTTWYPTIFHPKIVSISAIIGDMVEDFREVHHFESYGS